MSIARPSVDEFFLALAHVAATRSTCRRRAVGCVLVDARRHVLATGYNGPPAGAPHCLDAPCPGADAPSGEGLDRCEALHAEQNALLQCQRPYEIETAYCTTAPCVTCVKLLLNTACRRLVFTEGYAHDAEARRLWERGRGERAAVLRWPPSFQNNYVGVYEYQPSWDRVDFDLAVFAAERGR